jgi:hypothetical protein
MKDLQSRNLCFPDMLTTEPLFGITPIKMHRLTLSDAALVLIFPEALNCGSPTTLSLGLPNASAGEFGGGFVDHRSQIQ